MQTADQAGQLAAGFSTYQKWVVGLLTFLQFSVILDFMILSPLGAILMPQLSITPAQFGLVVSVYAFSAGASGLLAAGFVAGTILALVISLTVGLFGFKESIHASFVVESLILEAITAIILAVWTVIAASAVPRRQ